MAGLAHDGVTGRLSVTLDGRVAREELPWARFAGGRPVPVSAGGVEAGTVEPFPLTPLPAPAKVLAAP